MIQELQFRLLNRWLIVLLSAVLMASCKLENERITLNPSKALSFSADTVYFDTVFTELKSVTLRLRVFNPNKNAIRIRSVYVNGVNGTQPFSFSINGRTGPHKVDNVELEGLDSAYVLMTARLDGRNLDNPFIIKDSLVFEVEGADKKQDVKILAYGQDALYLRERSISCDTIWNDDRPIILLDTVSVKPGCKLTIKPGARIYGYNSAFLIVRGEIQAGGSLEKPIVFQGTRLESYYATVPGQWGGILIMDGGYGYFNHIKLKNAFRGIQAGEVGFKQPPVPNAGLLITNSYIQNIVDYGILGVKAVIAAINNQIADCGEGGFTALQGGNYQLWHNTFGFSGNNPYKRDGKYQLAFADHYPDPRTQTLYGGKLSVKAVNNLIHGSEEDEIAFGDRKVTTEEFDTLFHNNLIRSKQGVFFGNTIKNKGNRRFPDGFRFLSPFEYDLAPDTLGSAELFATGASLQDAVSIFPVLISNLELRDILAADILGKPRPAPGAQFPDIGAYNNRKKKN